LANTHKLFFLLLFQVSYKVITIVVLSFTYFIRGILKDY
jgi:hypothetical protein